MPGSWLTAIGRRLTREDTFERLVSPAIADLQCEARLGWFRRCRHYAAIAAVFAWALQRDFSADVALAFDADAWRRVWARAAVWALAAGFCNWSVTYVLTIRSLSQWSVGDSIERLVLDSIVFTSIVPALTVAMIVAAYNLTRREPGRMRAVVAATVVLAGITLVASYVAITVREPAWRAMDQAVSGLRPERVITSSPLPWRMFIAAVHMVPFAWLGVVLARRRGWPLALSATALLGTWMLVTQSNVTLVALLDRAAPSLGPILYGTYAVPEYLITLPVLILLWRMIESRVDHRGSAQAGRPA